ncbi:Malonyl-[acyl-carrier protein] O-methyltransferase [Nymphon striatum]|nr:Malonyl-[acyl-carrier protein] O-methyltransferase [Nymphon striatum]
MCLSLALAAFRILYLGGVAVVPGVGKVHIVGWSLGGLVAQALADQEPDLVKSLTLVASTLRFSQDENKDSLWSHAMSKKVLQNFSVNLKEDTEGTLKRFIALQFMGVKNAKEIQKELIQDICKIEKTPKSRGVTSESLELGLNLLTESDFRLHKSKHQQHWIFAEKDRLIPKDVINDLKSLRSDAQITLLKNAGHAPFMTHPDEFMSKTTRLHFERAADTYDASAVLQKEIATRLSGRLDYIKHSPKTVLDVGSGTGFITQDLLKRYPKSSIIALDLAHYTFGPETLREMRESWAAVDNVPHTSNFLDMHEVGDALLQSGFVNPVTDMEMITMTYANVRQLMRDIKQIGASNTHRDRSKGLMGKQKLKAFEAAYEQFKTSDELYPATWEIIYGHAWVGEGLKLDNFDHVIPIQKV